MVGWYQSQFPYHAFKSLHYRRITILQKVAWGVVQNGYVHRACIYCWILLCYVMFVGTLRIVNVSCSYSNITKYCLVEIIWSSFRIQREREMKTALIFIHLFECLFVIFVLWICKYISWWFDCPYPPLHIYNIKLVEYLLDRCKNLGIIYMMMKIYNNIWKIHLKCNKGETSVIFFCS